MRSASRFLRKYIIAFLFFTLLAAFVVLVFFSYALDLQWTGIPAYFNVSASSAKQYQPAKTLWDWLQLLIIPFGLAIVAYWLNRAERRNDQKNTLDNQRGAALQTYIDNVSELLLREDLDKVEEKSVKKILTIIRARTLQTLKLLDPDRKTNLFGFLWGAGLIGKFSLDYADLSGANLSGTSLIRVNLSRANLYKANLQSTTLDHAKLINANLKGANLRNAMLYDADLRNADLHNADFTDAYLTRANINGASYKEKQLKKATKSDNLIR